MTVCGVEPSPMHDDERRLSAVSRREVTKAVEIKTTTLIEVDSMNVSINLYVDAPVVQCPKGLGIVNVIEFLKEN
jgi:hypothetical protein